MKALSKSLLVLCKERLLDAKAQLLNQVLDQRTHLTERRFTGDEGDLSAQAADENHLYIKNQRLREQLLEVESALARIENQTFGVCEETLEPIEEDRLLAIPWTRYSLEGAEIHEQEGRSRRPRG